MRCYRPLSMGHVGTISNRARRRLATTSCFPTAHSHDTNLAGKAAYLTCIARSQPQRELNISSGLPLRSLSLRRTLSHRWPATEAIVEVPERSKPLPGHPAPKTGRKGRTGL